MEKTIAPADTPHGKADNLLMPIAPTGDNLRTSATNIDDEPGLIVIRQHG
jgi:hypothetical protein